MSHAEIPKRHDLDKAVWMVGMLIPMMAYVNKKGKHGRSKKNTPGIMKSYEINRIMERSNKHCQKYS